MPWVGLKCYCGASRSYSLRLLLIGQFTRERYSSHKRTSKDQTRLHIGAVLSEPLQIAVKRRDVDEGSGKFYMPVQESLVLVTYANSGESGEIAHLRSLARAFANRTKRRDVDEGSGQIL